MSVNLNNINGFGGNFYAQRISSNNARTASIQSQLDDRNQKIANIDRKIAKHEKSIEYIQKENALIKESMVARRKYIALLKESRALGEERLQSLNKSQSIRRDIINAYLDTNKKLQALLDKADGKVAQKTEAGAKLDIVIDNKLQSEARSTERKQLDISEVPVNAFKKKATPEATVVEVKNNIAPVMPSKTSLEHKVTENVSKNVPINKNIKQDVLISNKVPSSPKHEISKEAYNQYKLDSERLSLLSTKLLTSSYGYFGEQPELSDYIGTTNYPDFIYSKIVSGYLNKLS